MTWREDNDLNDMSERNPDDITIDPEFLDLWEWFWELSDGRAEGFNSPQPIPYMEIDAWQRLTGVHIGVEGVKILKAMDSAFLSGLAEWRAEVDRRQETKNGHD